ncbi:MAG: LacI family DNA-binding transcriptional regulator [Bacteroidia bacterium]|nr:LacI family DNA-binding transcriptional regulator [Bacteroidia bacterium]
MIKNKKVSLADIAMALGVSKTLVSMVLNGKGDENGISKKTQERVMELAEEMNYKPNQFARGLRIGRSNTIGLIVSDISNPFYSRLARSVEDAVSESGYNLMICSSDESEEKEMKLLEMLINKQVDGIILSSTLDSTEHIESLQSENFPFVLIDRVYNDFETNTVVVDNLTGAKEAVEFLINNGHRKIAALVISPAHISTQVDRLEGYKEALKKYSIPINQYYQKVIPRDEIYSAINQIFVEWKSDHMMPTAVFVANNQLAIGCLETIRDLGLTIPRDISIVSFDDIDLFKLYSPPITSVIQPINSIARNAVEILLDNIKIKDNSDSLVKTHKCLQTNIVVRNSVLKLA